MILIVMFSFVIGIKESLVHIMEIEIPCNASKP